VGWSERATSDLALRSDLPSAQLASAQVRSGGAPTLAALLPAAGSTAG